MAEVRNTIAAGEGRACARVGFQKSRFSISALPSLFGLKDLLKRRRNNCRMRPLHDGLDHQCF